MSKPLPVLQPLAAPGAEHVVEVAFKGNRRGFYTTTDDSIRQDDHVIVEAERGQDLGRVRSLGGVAKSKCSSSGSDGSARLLRRAEPEEVRQWIVLRADEDRVRRQTRELVAKHRLKMKVSEAEWQWDRNKLTIFFTAERRVDFRELVRELARTFRTRIELKQIGVRDEAALLGGLGRCGRQLCCATWLREIRPVSLQLAKDQNLSLNPSQISGTCGRLMCCLTYEHDSYVQARKRYPREGKILQTARGAEKVIGIDIWRETVVLLDENRQRRTITLAELKQETASTAPPRRERGQDAAPGATGDGERMDDGAAASGSRRDAGSGRVTAETDGSGEAAPQPARPRRQRPPRRAPQDTGTAAAGDSRGPNGDAPRAAAAQGGAEPAAAREPDGGDGRGSAAAQRPDAAGQANDAAAGQANGAAGRPHVERANGETPPATEAGTGTDGDTRAAGDAGGGKRRGSRRRRGRRGGGARNG